MHSKLSKGERYDQFEKVKNGEVSVIIGPRSALFAPFSNLGIIVIDEEHESTYKSEYPPKYHAREVAIQRAKMSGACVLLGSATPSVESYYKASTGEYKLLVLEHRANKDAALADVSVVDLREELKNEISYMPLIRIVESMQAAVEKIPIKDAFDELDSDREYYQEKRKEANDRLISRKSMIGKAVGFAPMICLFVGYLIVPLVFIGMTSMSGTFSQLGG